MNSKLLVIVGPTASGKSALALELAKKFNGEIICADSRTVYRSMDIGTAKPSDYDMLQIPHHLLNVVAPDERFTAAQFQILARAAIQDISDRGRLPIMVGGTGLYIDSVLFDYQFPREINNEFRIMNQQLSLEQLVEKLRELDSEAVENVDLNNRRRVERAIEVVGLVRTKSAAMRSETLVLGTVLDKNIIQERIEQRIKKMLEQGLIEEVKALVEKYGWDNEALRAPAYLAFREVVLGQKTSAEAAAEFAKRDMNLAKRQMTWFKRNKKIIWLDGSDPQRLLVVARDLVSLFLNP